MNKTAIIIGASSGIGLETGKLLITHGYDVYGISRTTSPQESGINSLIADAAASGTITSAIDSVGAQKPIDVLVYSAGYSLAAPIEFANESDYRYLFDVNYFGIIESIKAVIPYMQSGGRIILVSSMAGTFPIAFDTFYSSSKAAVDMLAKSADIELMPYGIHVCALKPGGVSTRFTFKRKVYKNVGQYQNRQNKAVSMLADDEQSGADPKKVAQNIYSVITSASPPVVVASGIKNKATMFASKLLPSRMVQYISDSTYNDR